MFSSPYIGRLPTRVSICTLLTRLELAPVFPPYAPFVVSDAPVSFLPADPAEAFLSADAEAIEVTSVLLKPTQRTVPVATPIPAEILATSRYVFDGSGSRRLRLRTGVEIILDGPREQVPM